MRFGKKLALMTLENGPGLSDRPFVSHREAKELMTIISRDIRNGAPDVSSNILKCQKILVDDLERVKRYKVSSENALRSRLLDLVREADSLGITGASKTCDLLRAIQNLLSSPSYGLHESLGEHLKAVWLIIAQRVAPLADRFNALAHEIQRLVSYCDLNAAGFRKLIKQYFKQVPPPHFVRIMDPGDYGPVLCTVLTLVAETNSLRERLQETVDALSPGVQEIKRVRIGNELMLASVNLSGCMTLLWPEIREELPLCEQSPSIPVDNFPTNKASEPPEESRSYC